MSVKRTVLYGPMQLFLIGFKGNQFKGEISATIKEAKEKGIIRLIDYAFIMKDDNGKISAAKGRDLGRAEVRKLDSVIGALLGYGMAGIEGAKAGITAGAEFGEHDIGITEEDVQDLVGYIPDGTSALLMIVEHLWAKKIKQALVNANGAMIAQGMLTPELVMRIGAKMANDMQIQYQSKPSNLGMKPVLNDLGVSLLEH